MEEIKLVSFYESKYFLLSSYMNNKDENAKEKLIEKHPEYEHIDMFIKIAEEAYNNFTKTKYCSFVMECDNMFSLIDCTFEGYDDFLYITNEDPNICLYPTIMYDRSCVLYINVPEDFDEDPSKYKEEFIIDAIQMIAKTYVNVLNEDANGLTGKVLPNPDYIEN